MIDAGFGPLILCAVLVAAFALGYWLLSPRVRRYHDRAPDEPTPLWPAVAVAAFAVGSMLAAAWLFGLLDGPAQVVQECR